MEEPSLQKLVNGLNALLDASVSPHAVSLAFDGLASEAKQIGTTITSTAILATYSNNKLQSLSDLKLELQDKGDYIAAAGTQQAIRNLQQLLCGNDALPFYGKSKFTIQGSDILFCANPKETNGKLLMELVRSYFVAK